MNYEQVGTEQSVETLATEAVALWDKRWSDEGVEDDAELLAYLRQHPDCAPEFAMQLQEQAYPNDPTAFAIVLGSLLAEALKTK